MLTYKGTSEREKRQRLDSKQSTKDDRGCLIFCGAVVWWDGLICYILPVQALPIPEFSDGDRQCKGLC